jgi:hypothetical protein
LASLAATAGTRAAPRTRDMDEPSGAGPDISTSPDAAPSDMTIAPASLQPLSAAGPSSMAGLSQQAVAIGGHAHHADVRRLAQDLLDAPGEDGVVLTHHHADDRRGSEGRGRHG